MDAPTPRDPAEQDAAPHPRPWLSRYPRGIAWEIATDPTPVHERVLAAAARAPEATALDFLGHTTSFGRLAHDIEALAGALQARFGVTKGTRVALLLPNTPFFPVAYYAVLRAGGTVVNTNPLYTVPELTHILRNARADILITLDLKLVFEKAEALAEAGHVRSLVVCHFPDALPPLKKALFSLFRRKDLANPAASRVAGRITAYSALLARGDVPAPVTIDPYADIAVQQYTGGTTGSPKGALLTHANIAANVDQLNAWADGLFNPPNRIVAVLPFFHIFAMTACLNLPLCNGAQVVMLPRFEMKPFLQLLRRTQPSVLLAVPTLLNALARSDLVGAKDLACLKAAVSGGAPLAAEVREAFARKSPILLCEGYGLTEASPVVCCAPLREPAKDLSVGQPIPATDLRIVDIETGAPAPIGANGEVQVRGPQVMAGYFENPEATREVIADGWLKTGDVGHIDEDGFVFLIDRIKDIILCSGVNVYPRDVEEAVLAHPAVEEVTVIGVPDAHRGETPVAFVKLRAGETADAREISSFISGRLHRLAHPREIIFRDTLPKTLIGKLSKKELREDYAKMMSNPS